MIVNMVLKMNFNVKTQKMPPSGRLEHSVWHIILDVVVGIVAAVLTYAFPALAGVWWGLYASFLSIDIPTSSLNAHLESVRLNREARSTRTAQAEMAVAKALAAGIDSNGQLISGRQSSDTVRVCYGIVMTAGTWVFSKVSRATDTILNNVISWGEGEIEGLATAIDFTPIYTGSTLNDFHTGGTFVYAGCSCNMSCYAYSPCSCNMVCYVYN